MFVATCFSAFLKLLCRAKSKAKLKQKTIIIIIIIIIIKHLSGFPKIASYSSPNHVDSFSFFIIKVALALRSQAKQQQKTRDVKLL